MDRVDRGLAETQILLTNHRKLAMTRHRIVTVSPTSPCGVMLYLLFVLFGCLTGVSTVLFGFGGGFVVVPLLYRTLANADGPGPAAMHVAVATSTAVMIVNAWLATRKHRLAGNILSPYIWPLAGFIGLGAVVGAGAAVLASDDIVRFAFVAYLAATLADCLLRRGFLSHAPGSAPRPLGHAQTVAGGVVIGVVATFLGVGGSVMTVPLLRRRGLSMTHATAMANPLSLPVAVLGTLTYAAMAWHQPLTQGPRYLGNIDLAAFALLSLGSLAGIRLAGRWVGRIPDRIHARVYIALLALVMASMMIK